MTTDALVVGAESPPRTDTPALSFKEREQSLLQELAALYSKLEHVREKRVKAEEESGHSHDDDADASSSKSRKRRRVLLVTRSLPFTLVWEDAQSQWRAEFPENMSLDGAMETYLYLHEHYDCVWIGSVHGDIEPSEQNALKEQLLDERKYCPVFLDPKRERLFYHGFCKTVMWPLFHSCPPTTDDQLKTHSADEDSSPGNLDMDKMWQAYVSVNQAFADTIQEVYEDGDLVWIQGYHFTLVPQMVQSLFPNDNVDIGYFLHIPFPSSELYRIMNNRDEILTGMLGADLIGFQTHEYARHFQSAAVRLLGLESSHKGVEYNGHFARVGICPVGIDAAKYTSLVRASSVQDQIAQLTQQFSRKRVILGVDPLDSTKGLVHKLLAVEELFTTHPELSQDVVFLQIVTGTPSLLESPLGSQVEALVSRINSKLQDIGADGPVQYLNKEIPQEALVALYTLAHALVVTPIRDGMNTIPFEYVVCREAVNKPARVVLSEFAGSADALSGATLVNPWNTEEVVDALLAALQSSSSHDDSGSAAHQKAHQSMYSYVRTFTSKHWADSFLDQLRECSDENALAVSGRELSRRDMTSAYIRSSRRLLFITYEGVLAAEASIPELSYPPQELIWQLSLLTKDPRNTVVLVCSRSTAVCEQWFAGLSGRIVLAAEYGVYIKWLASDDRSPRDASWHCMVPHMDMAWWTHVVPLLEYYTERTPGAFIERKDSSVAWHYRDCDLDHGLWQASELLVSLRELTRSLPVAVVPGNRVLEVRPERASKAWLFERIWEFMNYAVLFPDDDAAALTTDYFGDRVALPSSPRMAPVAGPSEMDAPAPLSLAPTHDQSATSSSSDDDERAKADDAQPVDFLLVIASGEDRTDEDLFAYLVPAPIDLDAYCPPPQKEPTTAADSTHRGGATVAAGGDEMDRRLATSGSFRRLAHRESSSSSSAAVSDAAPADAADRSKSATAAPQRDFPPSAALFKAMKTKYGESFSMHRLPDTPAAAWALVDPPLTPAANGGRSKLEDQTLRRLSSSQALDRKASFGVPASSPHAPPGDGDAKMRREIAALRSLDKDAAAAAAAAKGGNQTDTQEDGNDDDDDRIESPYRFPVNTFVCTLGRKLSQAPYFIKNSADLYQLLQEMGLNSHIRKQRMLSMGSHVDE